MQKAIIGGWKNNISIWPKLESVTAYYIRFVVKLLWKCCECSSTTLIFVEFKFL